MGAFNFYIHEICSTLKVPRNLGKYTSQCEAIQNTIRYIYTLYPKNKTNGAPIITQALSPVSGLGWKHWRVNSSLSSIFWICCGLTDFSSLYIYIRYEKKINFTISLSHFRWTAYQPSQWCHAWPRGRRTYWADQEMATGQMTQPPCVWPVNLKVWWL